ncbi:MAG: hypothetical protein L3J39_13295 [Verrucomicrobiales bacterium]|nr:hypothetical protein [Verrucomicrobiales bacterium]
MKLAPDRVHKEEPSFDLPITVGEDLKDGSLEQCSIIDQLALDGRVNPVKAPLSTSKPKPWGIVFIIAFPPQMLTQ